MDEKIKAYVKKIDETIDAGKFKEEIVPVEIKTRKGVTVVDTDEHPIRGANLESMDGFRVHTQSFGQAQAQSRRIQHQTTADHLLRRQSRITPGQIRHDVHRVGHHQENPVKATLHDGLNDGFEHLGVALQELHAGLAAFFLRDARGDHHHVAVASVGVTARANLQVLWRHRNRVRKVHGFALGIRLINIC